MYKIGDKVKIKSLDWYNNNLNRKEGGVTSKYMVVQFSYAIFNGEMKEYCGLDAIITNVFKAKDYYYYKLSIDNNGWCWYDDFFVCVKEERKEKLKRLKFNAS